MSDTFIDVDKLEWQTVKIHEQPPYDNEIYLYELELFKPLADWDVWRYWERERIESMQKHIKQGDLLFDVGAEQGWMSALFSKYMTENLVLIEPTREFWPGIKAIYKKNRLKTPLECFVGFADTKTSGDTDFGWPKMSSEVIEKRKYENIFDTNNTWTPSRAIDDFDIVPNHISIDVEGAELLVLKGAEHTLKTEHPLVWVSVHPDMMERDYGHTREDLLFFMDECGYEAELLAVDHEEHWFLS